MGLGILRAYTPPTTAVFPVAAFPVALPVFMAGPPFAAGAPADEEPCVGGLDAPDCGAASISASYPLSVGLFAPPFAPPAFLPTGAGLE